MWYSPKKRWRWAQNCVMFPSRNLGLIFKLISVLRSYGGKEKGWPVAIVPIDYASDTAAPDVGRIILWHMASSAWLNRQQFHHYHFQFCQHEVVIQISQTKENPLPCVRMKQSSINPFEKGLIPSPFALQVKIFTHLMSVGWSGAQFNMVQQILIITVKFHYHCKNSKIEDHHFYINH